MKNRMVHCLVIAAVIVSLLATTLIGINHGQVAASSTSDLINAYTSSSIPVDVDGTVYWIVTLSKRIDPETLAATAVPGEVKVFVDGSGNPVSDPAIARKISVIEYVLRQHDKGYVAALSQTNIQQINSRLQLHETIRWGTFLEDQLAWGAATALLAFAGSGPSAAGALAKAGTAGIDLLSDPKLVLGLWAKIDLQAAITEYGEWSYLDSSICLNDYASAEAWFRHDSVAGMLWERGRVLLDGIDEIDKPILREAFDFLGHIGFSLLGNLGLLAEKSKDLVDTMKNDFPCAVEYIEKVKTFNTDIELRLAKIGEGGHTQYTLALAERVEEEIPDLTVPAPVRISPTSAEAGDMISVTYTVKNIGTGPTGYFTNRVSLDSSHQWGTSIFVGNSEMLPLGSGAFRTVTERVLIPPIVAPGTYYVTLYTDVFQVVDKTNENNMNNIGSTTPLKLTIKPAATVDLSVSNIVAPSSATPGDTVSVSFTTRNSGNSACGPFAERVFLGTSPTCTTFPLASIDIDSLAAGGTCSRSLDVTIPGDATAGAYYIDIYADAFGEIQETNENNNIGSVPFTVSSSIVPQYTLTIGVYGSGTTLPGVGTHTYAPGTVVPIEAWAIGSGVFSNWVGDVASPYASVTTVTMDGDKSVTASFWSTEDVVTIPDPVLEGAIREAINKPSGLLYKSDLAAVTELYIAGYDFTSLAGLEYCTNLVELKLMNDGINDSDLTTISKLTNLRTLNLQTNQITNVSALARLTNLESLGLMYNQISDIRCLAGLTKLQQLYLSSNTIVDISPLANMNLLQQLGLAYNEIRNISVLAHLTDLTVLDLGGNRIDNINALSNLTNLQYLTLYANVNIDLSVLSNLTNLTTLSLDDNNIKDISALAGLTNIHNLGLSNNRIDDISALASMVNLRWVFLSNNRIRDISVLSTLTDLEELRLDGNQIADTSGISTLTNLVVLYLNNNWIKDIYPLTLNPGLGKDDYIDISYNYIDTEVGSQQADYIQALESRQVWQLIYEPQNGPASTLTICVSGSGDSSPLAGIYLYPSGSVVDITATAGVNWHFIEWTGDVDTIDDANSSITQITMNNDCLITASFGLDDGLPDLMIQASDVSYAWNGGAIDVTVNVHNIGLQTAENAATDIYSISEEGNAELIGHVLIESVGAGEVASINSTWVSPPSAQDLGGWLGVIANSDHSIAESDDANNQVFIPLENEEPPSPFPFCFIATAAYGTPMAPEIQTLRDFRDQYLLTNPLGQAFVNLYYCVSPPAADFITDHPSLKPIVRAWLVPIVAVSAVAITTNGNEKIALVVLLVLIAAAVAVWLMRRRGRGSEYDWV